MRDALSLLESVAGRALQVTYGPAQTGDMQRTKADTGQDRARARLAGRNAASRRSLEALAMGRTR